MKVVLYSQRPSEHLSTVEEAMATVVPESDLVSVACLESFITFLRTYRSADIIAILVVEDTIPPRTITEIAPLLDGSVLFIVADCDVDRLTNRAYELNPRFVLSSTPNELQLLVRLVFHYLSAS